MFDRLPSRRGTWVSSKSAQKCHECASVLNRGKEYMLLSKHGCMQLIRMMTTTTMGTKSHRCQKGSFAETMRNVAGGKEFKLNFACTLLVVVCSHRATGQGLFEACAVVTMKAMTLTWTQRCPHSQIAGSKGIRFLWFLSPDQVSLPVSTEALGDALIWTGLGRMECFRPDWWRNHWERLFVKVYKLEFCSGWHQEGISYHATNETASIILVMDQKLGPTALLTPLAKLFNLSLLESKFPEAQIPKLVGHDRRDLPLSKKLDRTVGEVWESMPWGGEISVFHHC